MENQNIIRQNDFEKPKEEKARSLDDVLAESVGKWGWFQIWFGVIIWLYESAYAPCVYGPIYADFTPNHHCISSENETFSQEIWENETNRCHTFINGIEEECSMWAYDKSHFTETVSMRFSIVCENAYIRTLSGTLRMFGLLIGSLVFGWLADVIGRVPTITIAGTMIMIAQLVAAFSVNYLMFSICYMVIAAGGVGTYIVGFVILFEWVCPEKRTFAATFAQIPFGIGFLYTILIGYLNSHWFTIQLVFAVPNLFFLLVYPIAPETPRWLVSVGKTERALKSINVAAKSNGLPLADHIPSDGENKSEGEDLTNAGMIGLMKKKKLLIRLIVMSLEWIVITMCFYGLSFNSGKQDLFKGTGLMAGVEVLAYFIILFTIDIAGRRPVLSFCQIFAGLSCLCSGFVPAEYFWPRLTLALVGKMGASAAFAVVFVYTAELFHTPVRNSALGMCSTLARFGALLAPTIADLDKVEPWLPFVIMGGGSIIVGILAFLLPETRGCELPATIEEAMTIGMKPQIEGDESKKQNFLSKLKKSQK